MDIVTAPVAETWDLTGLFRDDQGFEEARQELRRAIVGLDRWRGRLGESAGLLAEALETITDAYRRFALLRCYASLRSDADTRVADFQAMRQGVELLATELSGKVSYLRPEILAFSPETVESCVESEPRLAPHAFFLRDLMRQRSHVLGPAEERIMAESSLLTRSASSIYQVIQNVDLPRPEIRIEGGDVRLTPVEFRKHRASQKREDRMRIFPAYYGAYAAFKDTLGHNLYAAVKGHMFQARTRRYDSCLGAALDADHVPAQVYRNLIRQVRDRLPLMHRYFELRARALGVERLEYPDLYSPLCSGRPASYSPGEARQLVLDSVAPIGEAYVASLAEAFDARWIDWHPAPGKRSGAYATGWAYDLHPYVLINFTGEYESVSTLAHEMGHAMHSFFSNRAQPFATADYSIFVAEVASTLNEALLAARMLETASTAQEERFLLGSYLDGIRGTLFRQSMFAEFELEIHERAERGEVLTGERLNEIYLDLLRSYHGHDRGVMHIADEYSVEWAAVPHFYYDFYVYQYATGIVAATALAEALLQDVPRAAARCIEFLSAGGSDYPLNLLRRTGVDLETAAPYDSAFRAVERHLERLEELLDSPESG